MVGLYLFPWTCCTWLEAYLTCPGQRTEGLQAFPAEPWGQDGGERPLPVHQSPWAAGWTWLEQGHGFQPLFKHLLGGHGWELQAGLVKVCGLVLGMDGYPDGWSDDCYLETSLPGVWTKPSAGSIWKLGLEADPSWAWRGRGGACDRVSTSSWSRPVSSCPCITWHDQDEASAPYWPHRALPGLAQLHLPHSSRVPNLPWSQVWWLWVCGSLDLEYSSQLQRFQFSCMSLVKLLQTNSWTPFLIPLVFIMLCAPPHDNSSLTASLRCSNLVSMHLLDSGLPERTLGFGALLHLVLGNECGMQLLDVGVGLRTRAWEGPTWTLLVFLQLGQVLLFSGPPPALGMDDSCL